jgi:pimeloyl-ACP methyl ester carboxylesterase
MLCSLIRQWVFLPPTPSSYNTEIEGLLFAQRTVRHLSSVSIFQIPYFYEIIDPVLPTILFSHGNAEDIGQYRGHLNSIARALHANVCVYDYVGYGLNAGTPSEKHCYDDVVTIYSRLVNFHGVSPENIILCGRSLGSGPACYLAESLCDQTIPFRGLILLSPIASVIKTVMIMSFWGDPFPNYRRAPRITCRTILLHGDQDTVVPMAASIELDQALAGPHEFRLLEGRSHNNIWIENEDDRACVLIRQFFNL